MNSICREGTFSQRGTEDYLREAQRRLDEKRQALKATTNDTIHFNQTPRLPDFQENQDRQVLQESAEADLSPSAAGNEEKTFQELFDAGNYGDVPIREFLSMAWAESEGNSWAETGVSESWEFTRYLLAHPKFRDLTPAGIVKKLRQLTDFEDELLTTIFDELPCVKYARGLGPIEWAVAQAKQVPLTDPEGLGLERYNEFLGIAGWLQVTRPDTPIFLPVKKLAEILNVSARQVSTWRSIAKRQGLLTEVTPYQPHKKATEFRFDTNRFAVLRERFSL